MENQKKTILCFGDSLTSGFLDPFGVESHPYALKLGSLLGSSWEFVIFLSLLLLLLLLFPFLFGVDSPPYALKLGVCYCYCYCCCCFLFFFCSFLSFYSLFFFFVFPELSKQEYQEKKQKA